MAQHRAVHPGNVMKQQIEALQAEVTRLIKCLDEAESLLQEAAPFCPRRPAGKAVLREVTADDLGNRIDEFLSRLTE